MANSTDFLIDIVARMTGGANASKELDAVTDALVNAGTSSEDFDAAMAATAKALEASKAAMSSATAALGAQQKAYDQAQVSADKAAKAVERYAAKAPNVQRITSQAERTQAAFDKATEAVEQTRLKVEALKAAGNDKGAAVAAINLEAQLRRQNHAQVANERAQANVAAIPAAQAKHAEGLAQRQVVASAAKDKLTGEGDKLDAAKAEVERAEKAHKKLEATQKNLVKTQGEFNKVSKTSGERAKMAGDALQKMGLPVGGVTGKVSSLVEGYKGLTASLGKAGPYGAAAAGVVILWTAVLAATAGVLKFAVAMADAQRNAQLFAAGLEVSSASFRGFGDAAHAVASETGLTQQQLAGIAQSLDGVYMSAERMQAGMRAIAIATAGGASARYLQRLNVELKSGRKSAADLAAEVDKQFGGIVQRKMLGLDAQMSRFKLNLQETFGKLPIEPLLQALSKLVALFDAGTASGKTLTFLFSKFFGPLVGDATNAGYAIERMFLQAEIWALKAYIALKPYKSEISTLTGYAKTAAMVVGGVLLVAIGLVGAAVAAIAVPFIMAGLAIGKMVAAAQNAWDAVSNIEWGQLGSDIIDGIVGGISSGAKKVVDSITGVAKDAISAAKNVLGIHSPSRVFRELGGMTAEGFAGGVDDGGSEVTRAVNAMLEPPTKPADAPAARAGSSSSVNLSGATFVFNGVAGAEDAESRFGAMLTKLLEGDALQLGGGEVPA